MLNKTFENMCEPHKQSLFGHDTDVSSIKNQIQAYGSKLPTLVCDFSFAHKLYLENCIHENISKRKEFINLNEHVKIETSSNIREYVARDTSSIKRRTKKQAEHSYARECGGYAKRAQGGCLGTKSR